MEVSTDAYLFCDLFSYCLDFIRTIAGSQHVAKAKRISKRFALIFIYAEAVSQARKLAKRVAKIMLSCVNVSRVKKMEGAGGIFERKFCQLCSLEVAGPVDNHHAISII